MKLNIKDTIKYFLVGESVYLRDTSTYKDYLFNSIAYDILRVISDNPGCTQEELLHSLQNVYEIEDAAAFRSDIFAFLRQLVDETILTTDVPVSDKRVGTIQEQIQEYYTQHHMLYNVCLELTYRCNERCIHCYVDDQKFGPELSLDDYRSIIDQLVDLGCVYLLLTGGEVSLHPSFLEIAEYASMRGLLVNIYTNGYRISKEQLTRMIRLHPNSISFSLYSADPSVHDSITGIPGSFHRSLRTAMACKCAGIDTFIKTIGLKQNFDTLEGLFQLGKQLHIPVELAKLVMSSHTGAKRTLECRLESPEDFYRLFQLEEQYTGKIPQKQVRTSDTFFCSAGLCTLSIDPYGNVHPCNALHMCIGNIKQKPLSSIWENSLAIIETSFPKGQAAPQCTDCSFVDYCSVCLGALCEEQNFLLKDDGICTIAKGAYQFSQKRRNTR